MTTILLSGILDTMLYLSIAAGLIILLLAGIRR